LITHVVIDIEGTTSSTGFVHRTLYPYSRERFRGWIDAHRDRTDVRAMIDVVRELAAEPEADIDRVVWWLNHWFEGLSGLDLGRGLLGW
jgi:methionine salvage enolase-phosphatase E1